MAGVADLVVMGTVVTGEVAGSATVRASIWATTTMTIMIAATIATVGGFAGTKPASPVVLVLPGLLQRSGFIYSNGAFLVGPIHRRHRRATAIASTRCQALPSRASAGKQSQNNADVGTREPASKPTRLLITVPSVAAFSRLCVERNMGFYTNDAAIRWN